MASRKEKHARMLAKREEREAAIREIGQKALEVDRRKRASEKAREMEEAHQVHLKRNRFHNECEHCDKVKAQQAIDRLAKAAAKRNEHSEKITNLVFDGASEAEIATAIEDSQKDLAPHKGDDTVIDLSRVEKISA
jgi:hypothetical protein